MLGHELESGDREREVGSILPKNWSISVECTGCTWDGDFFLFKETGSGLEVHLEKNVR